MRAPFNTTFDIYIIAGGVPDTTPWITGVAGRFVPQLKISPVETPWGNRQAWLTSFTPPIGPNVSLSDWEALVSWLDCEGVVMADDPTTLWIPVLTELVDANQQALYWRSWLTPIWWPY